MESQLPATTIIKWYDASVAQPLLPSTPSLAGHQTFALRSAWLKKGLDQLTIDPGVFSKDDALVRLGVGKNMVAAIRHWVLATRLASTTGERGAFLQATPLGTLLLADEGGDPYLEDPATLWLLHWHLCGPGSPAYTWIYAFNVWREWEWTAPSLAQAVQVATRASSAKAASPETVQRDVAVFLQTYVASTERGQNAEDGLDCPLRELGLLRAGFGSKQQYSFAVGPKASLPARVFAYALLKFWRWKYSGTTTIAARDIAQTEGSPGVIFKLDEDSVLAYLDQLDTLTDGALRFEDTPLVRQVVQTTATPPDPMALLHQHYALDSLTT